MNTTLLQDGIATLAAVSVPGDGAGHFQYLIARYCEQQRHYHNLQHLMESLKVAEELADEANDIAIVKLALWFHDAVYEPKQSDNEERSAELARETLSGLHVKPDVIREVESLILLTKHNAAEECSRNGQVLLDADLAILGSSPERYAEYAKDIRKEYHFVSDVDYVAGRTAVLQRFLNRPRIYRTNRAFKEREQRARMNIANEIQILGEPGA